MHLPRLIDAIHAVRSDSLAPYLESSHRHICATCPLVNGENCPCPMDYLAVLVVQAVETVDARRSGGSVVVSQGADRERKIAAARVTLTVEDGAHKGQAFTFDGRTTCLAGRALGCLVHFPDEPSDRYISRFHCLLEINPPAIRVQDLGSRNGTYVNGQLIGHRLKELVGKDNPDNAEAGYPLSDGDKLRLGSTVLGVHVSETEASEDACPESPGESLLSAST
jgi:hypothetical protein